MPKVFKVSAAGSLAAAIMMLFSCMPVQAAEGESESDSFPESGGISSFDPQDWNYLNAKKVNFLGRDCLAGTAILKDVDFSDGVLEVDLAFASGERAYGGFIFRGNGRDYEHIYLRAHRGGLYGDDIQYAPTTNGISSWQLYSGDGYSASYAPSAETWIHLKVVVKGSQAAVFIDGSKEPVLVVPRLMHGESNGSIGVTGLGEVYFSDFRYTTEADYAFKEPDPVDPVPGSLKRWKLSRPFRIGDLEQIDKRFDEKLLGEMGWMQVESDERGLVDVARFYGRSGREPDAVFAKHVIHSDKDEIRKFDFGYSDYISIFFNGDLVFSGNSAYRYRDPSFVGIVGLFDSVYLPLKKGDNELVLMVAESFGGWGFMVSEGDVLYAADGVTEQWEASGGLRTPESALYDPERGRVYVTNYDIYNQSPGGQDQFISILTPGGAIEELKWAGGLQNPTGMALYGKSLYVVERRGVAVIDPSSGKIEKRLPVPGSVFLNDIALDEAGRIYVSDTRKGSIFRYEGGQWAEWARGGPISAPNALYYHKGRLLEGNSVDGCLNAIDTESGKVEIFARLGAGNIDGIKSDGKDGLLVSQWEGRLFRVSSGGAAQKILDMRGKGMQTADFDFIAEQGLVILPGFQSNKVSCFRLDLR